MRAVIWVVLLFAMAAALALFSQQYSGSVFFAFDSQQVIYRVNFNAFLAGVFVLVCVLYALIHFLIALFRIPARVRIFNQRRKLKAARHALRKSGLFFFEGKYQKSEQQAKRSIDDEYASENRVLALLFAAHSAHLMRDDLERDHYLEAIKAEPGKLQLGRYLLEAEAALSVKKYEKAQESLAQANVLASNLPAILRMELKLSVALKQPKNTLQIVEKLLKADAIATEDAQVYRHNALKLQLSEIQAVEEMKPWLKSVSEEDRKGALGVAVAEKYFQLGAFTEAANWIEKYYSSSKNDRMLPVLSQSVEKIDQAGQRKALEKAEEWLKVNPHDEKLLLCLGQLAMAHQLWGKAQNYLDASLAISPMFETHMTLARLFNEIAQPDQAKKQEMKALSLIQKNA